MVGQFILFLVQSRLESLLPSSLNLKIATMDLDSKMEYPQERLSIAVLGCGWFMPQCLIL